MTVRAISLFATAFAGLLITGAEAAVTVIGPGPAEICYKAAEFGGDAADAIPTCSFALAGTLTKSDRAATFVNRGVLKLRLGRNDDAMSDINDGLSIDPDLGDAYVDRGAVAITLHHYDAALADLNKGIAMGAHRPQIAYYDRGIADEAMGDIRGAYEDYKKATEVEPDFAPAMDELKRFKVVRKPDGA